MKLLNSARTTHERKEEAMPKRKRKKEDGSKDEKKYLGVQRTKTGRFQAKISINNKRQALGTFDTAKKAARAYDRCYASRTSINQTELS